MLKQIWLVHGDALRAAMIFPVLFLIPALVVFAQHAVEIKAGMYDSVVGAKAAADDQAGLLLGLVAVLTMCIPGYWFVRFLEFRDPGRAGRIEQPAFLLWLVLSGFQGAEWAWSQFGPSLGSLLGLTGKAELTAGLLGIGVWTLLFFFLIAWFVAWPLGNRAFGPIRSIRVMAGSFWRTLGYMIGGVVPLVVVSSGLGSLATNVAPAWLDWPLIALDALVVALLACTTAGSSYLAAQSAAQRKGVNLAGGD